MTANHSRSEHLSEAALDRGPCLNCGASLAGRKDDAKYCSNRCKREAFDDRAHHGRVASVRKLKTGWSYVVHCDNYIGLTPGDKVRVG